MSRLSRTTSRIALGGLVAVGLAVAAATPISAHTGNLFTVVDLEGIDRKFATISTTDAAVTPLANGPSTLSRGVEISNEVAYAVLTFVEATPEIATWDHNTGAILSSVEITLDSPGDALFSVYGLDTTPTGALIAFADVEVENGEFPYESTWVVEIDPVTGVATPLIDLIALVQFAEEVEADVYFDSLATDPTTGLTYMFYDFDEDDQYMSILDLGAGTYSEGELLTQIIADLDLGYMGGADFDTAGTLWFYYFAPEEDGPGEGGLASTTGAFSAEVGAVSSGPAETSQNLAYDPYVAPQLAATGSELSVLAITAGALAIAGVGGALLLVSTRRRSA